MRRFWTWYLCTIAFVPTAVSAQEEIPPDRMVELLRTSSIECGVPKTGETGCSSVEEYSFITNTRGFVRTTVLFKVNDDEYLRMNTTDSFHVTEDGFCSTGASAFEDAHLEIVKELGYTGNFRSYELNDGFREVVQKQMLNPLIEMFESSTYCARYFIPENSIKPNEIEFASYLDGEFIEKGRSFLLSASEASRIMLVAEE